MMGGSASHEFMAFSENGEDTILLCNQCGYAANREVASLPARRAGRSSHLRAMEEVETPNTTTIQTLADFLDIPTSKTAKAVFFKGGIGPVRLRGHPRRPRCERHQAAQCHRRAGADAGDDRGNPRHRRRGRVRLAGRCARRRSSWSTNRSATRPIWLPERNRVGWHLKNVNLGRDYQADIVGRYRHRAEEGYPCPECGNPLHETRAIEVGNIFKLGTRYSDKLGATYLDANGESHPIVMGSYGIGSGRSAATVVEQRHDDKGIIWPLSIAPYHVSLVEIPSPDDPRPKEVAERLYRELRGSRRRGALRRSRRAARGEVQRLRPDRHPAARRGQRS